MNKLNELISKCKVSVNEYIDNAKSKYGLDNIHPDILNKMIELSTIVRLVIYPENQISFYRIWHYDLDLAIDEALEYLRDK